MGEVIPIRTLAPAEGPETQASVDVALGRLRRMIAGHEHTMALRHGVPLEDRAVFKAGMLSARFLTPIPRFTRPRDRLLWSRGRKLGNRLIAYQAVTWQPHRTVLKRLAALLGWRAR